MENKESLNPESTLEMERPDWHPFKVWRAQIRSQQKNNVIKQESDNTDELDPTGSWKTKAI